MKNSVFGPVCLMILALSGCQTAYYNTMERIGYDKREILVDRIQGARDEQEAAKEQFASALDQFTAVVHVEGGQLERQYRKLENALESSEYRAQQVRERIDKVEDVAEALFDEWSAELNEYESVNLRRQSEQQLRETRSRYERLMAAMRKAESRIEPVLVPMRDHVLFLKHNLNARAVASLEDELATIEIDVGALLKEMEAAIAEADTFIADMGTS